jgi:nitroreductase
MNVTEAAHRRRSIRAFRPDPVEDATIRQMLETASRAPSGGNLQPWRLYVLNGEVTTRFVEFIAGRTMERPGYDIYPKELTEPYRTSRYTIGEEMYALLGIPREDKAARFAHLARNYRFFDAPVGMFCFVDRQMGPPQWSDLGMFLQTFMLAASEAGLDTCPQEAWATWSGAVAEFVGAPDELMLFCGVALGYADDTKPVNRLVSSRQSVDEFTTWVS